MFPDPYYSEGEARERAEARMPRVAEVREDSVALDGKGGQRAELRVGQSAAGWELAAIVLTGGHRIAVLERHFAHWGLIAFVEKGPATWSVRKAIGELSQLPQSQPAPPREREEAILKSQADLLGSEVLRGGTEPSFDACAALLPDLVAYTFLGDERCADPVGVQPDGTLGSIGDHWGPKPLAQVAFDPRDHLPPHRAANAKRGLLGGYLPAIDYGFYDPESRLGWEEIAFVVEGPHGKPDLYVYLRVTRPDGSVERKWFRPLADGEKAIPASEFFARLHTFTVQWQARITDLKAHYDPDLTTAMHIEVPEQRVVDACRASLARAFITYEGDAPRYGVGHYRAPQHNTFPPTTLSMVNACVEWGHFARARRYLDWYLDHAVKPDGTFDYYGPAVSEYGQMLDAIARYVRRRPYERGDGDAEWLRQRLPKIESIVGRLLALRRESQAKFPKGELRHGLVFGSPEADTAKEVNYYFAGDAWTWRGLTETGRLFADLGDETMKRRGKELLAECDAYRADIEASLSKSIVRTTTPPFVPPVAGFDKPFPSMTADRFASYTNYRYWPEMLSPAFLRPEWHDAIIAYRVAHGGELLGTTRFMDRLDDWPYAGYAYGLLLRDRVRHFLLGFYGDLAAHRMRGTFTAYEQAAIRSRPTRRYVADYCVPAQLVIPLMAKWMLVFEEPDADVLWLCRATPRRWLAPGQRIVVERAATRWGMVSFAVSTKDDGSVAAQIRLRRADFPAELRLRLRRPDARPIRAVTVNGQPHADFDPQGELIRIARPQARVLDILVR
jgi:hypothetical protein